MMSESRYRISLDPTKYLVAATPTLNADETNGELFLRMESFRPLLLALQVLARLNNACSESDPWSGGVVTRAGGWVCCKNNGNLHPEFVG